MIALPRQPDDPGIEFPANPYATVVFGQRFAELDDATLRVIRKNAGKVPAITLAQALCWRMKRLQKIALAHGIDLRFHNDDVPPVIVGIDLGGGDDITTYNDREPRGA